MNLDKTAKEFAKYDVPMPQDIGTSKWQQGRYEGFLEGITVTMDKVNKWLGLFAGTYARQSTTGVEYDSCALIKDLNEYLKYE